MDPEAGDPENTDNLVPWSGSDGSQEHCVSESLSESYNEDDFSDTEYPLDPQPAQLPKSDRESPEPFESQDWETEDEQQSPPDVSEGEEEVSYQEEDDIYLRESKGSPHIQTSQTSLSSQPEHLDPDQIPQLHSHSSSSSVGSAADLTLALTLTTEQPLGASNRQSPGTRDRRVEASEEGGSGEAPPASVFFGISDEGAEHAEELNTDSDTDLCRQERHRTRCARKYSIYLLTTCYIPVDIKI